MRHSTTLLKQSVNLVVLGYSLTNHKQIYTLEHIHMHCNPPQDTSGEGELAIVCRASPVNRGEVNMPA